MKQKTVYICSECDYHSAKWLGRCPSCGEWNTMEEMSLEEEKPTGGLRGQKAPLYKIEKSSAVKLDELQMPQYMRCQTGCGELDRVLGGGVVSGSVVLLSGQPGIGKSTLLMQICGNLCDGGRKVLYISGEESPGQLKLRANRLKVSADNLYILTETNLDKIFAEIDVLKPDIIIADSIQTLYSETSSSSPGSVTQVKESAMRFIGLAKNYGASVILVGHVNKEGAIAGPKVLEHMVDAVLHFEGERDNSYRIIRAVKNRFGSTNEIGVFEMTATGLDEVPNPSEALLAGRPKNVSGNSAVCVMEGTRPLIAEIQALVSTTAFSAPRRASNGIDYNRLYVILAVLEKRFGLKFGVCDVYLNVIGGLKLDEPACDLPTALALVSSIKDKPIPDDMIAAGEIGLAGECRAISNVAQRINEAQRLGFKSILLPARSVSSLKNFSCDGIEIIPVKSIYEAITIACK